jgi:hypothetical protein
VKLCFPMFCGCISTGKPLHCQHAFGLLYRLVCLQSFLVSFSMHSCCSQPCTTLTVSGVDAAVPAVSRPSISFNTRFNAVLDPTPSAASNLDLATEGSHIDLLLRTNSAATAVSILQQSDSLNSPTASHAGVDSSAWTSDAPANPETLLMQWVRGVGEAPGRVWRCVGRLGMQLMPCVFRKQVAEVKREGSFFRKSVMSLYAFHDCMGC